MKFQNEHQKFSTSPRIFSLCSPDIVFFAFLSTRSFAFLHAVPPLKKLDRADTAQLFRAHLHNFFVDIHSRLKLRVKICTARNKEKVG